MKPFFTLNLRKPSRRHPGIAPVHAECEAVQTPKTFQLQRDGKLDGPMLINENTGDRPNTNGTPSDIRGEGRQDA
jgi:hypothetical protein